MASNKSILCGFIVSACVVLDFPSKQMILFQVRFFTLEYT